MLFKPQVSRVPFGFNNEYTSNTSRAFQNRQNGTRKAALEDKNANGRRYPDTSVEAYPRNGIKTAEKETLDFPT